MSLIFIDGFDLNDYNLGKYDSGVVESIVAGRYGGQAARMTGTGLCQKLFVPQEDDEIIVGFAAYMEHLTNDNSSNAQMMRLLSDSGVTVHLSWTVAPDGSVRIRRGGGNGTQLGVSATGVILLNTWHYVEVRAVLSDTVGVAEVYVDGVQVINQTGLDTKNGGTKTVFDGVSFGRVATTAWRVDDIYILNAQGTVNNTFLGDSKVSAVLPAANAAVMDWTSEPSYVPAYEAVNDGTPDSSEYIYSDVVDDAAMFDMGALPDSDHAVHGIQVSAYAAKDDAGDREMRFRADSDAVTEVSADIVLPSSFTTKTHIFELNPDGDVAWTPSTVDGATFGVEVR